MWVKFLSIVFYNAKRTQNSQLWYETATFEAQALFFKKPFIIFSKATARCDTNCNEDLRSARRKPTQTRLRATAARAPEHGVTPTVMRTFVLLQENQLKHAYAPQQRAHQSKLCGTNCNEDLRSASRKPTQTRLRAKAARAPEHGVAPTVMRTFVLLDENQLKHDNAPKQRARQSKV